MTPAIFQSTILLFFLDENNIQFINKSLIVNLCKYYWKYASNAKENRSE